MFDIDNRSGQETGYVFEPIVVKCIGAAPASAKTSKVRRRNDKNKGRQVDGIIDDRAYEIKLRITVAASGQGRWGEEKDFPVDCKAAGFKPVLIVFDSTQADKLDELRQIFLDNDGEVYIGDDAWQHLESLAGETMAVFMEKYVRGPLASLLASAPSREELPDLNIQQRADSIVVTIGDEQLTIARPNKAGSEVEAEEANTASDDETSDPEAQLALEF